MKYNTLFINVFERFSICAETFFSSHCFAVLICFCLPLHRFYVTIELMDELSKDIVFIAFEKFNLLGIRSVTVDDICKELRISKKTFYTAFNHKTDLVEAVLEYHEKLHFHCFAQNSKEQNAIETLIQIVINIKKNVEKEPFRFFYDLERYYPDIYESHRNKQHLVMRQEFEKNLERGIEEGYYRKDLDVKMISLFHSLQKNTLLQMMDTDDMKITRKQLVDFYIDVIVRLITNEKGLKYIQEKILL